MNPNDVIIKSAQKGNREAFRQIVESYQSIVFAVCFNVLKDYQEAENAAQETFIQVYNSLHSYEFKGFKTWISRIALNKSIDIRRKIQTSINYSFVPLNDNISSSISDNETPEDEIIRLEEKERINSLCMGLPEAYSTIINKYYLEDKSYEEIAREERISIKTVESRLYRGRKKLKESWGRGG